VDQALKAKDEMNQKEIQGGKHLRVDIESKEEGQN